MQPNPFFLSKVIHTFYRGKGSPKFWILLQLKKAAESKHSITQKAKISPIWSPCLKNQNLLIRILQKHVDDMVHHRCT
jgi:hypothetical protein